MSRTRSSRIWIVLLAVVAVVGAGIVWYVGTAGDLVVREHCEATVNGRTVDLTLEQAENAATIAAIAKQRKLPARAVTIALATAYQESKIRNLAHGHADSLGIFQQRPSMGVWGTAEQIRDPFHATNKFYDALVRIPDYEEMEITVAAQKVQRSAYPRAYAAHESDARVLASALTGNSPTAFACTVRVPTAGSDGADLRESLSAELGRAFGPTRVQSRGERGGAIVVGQAQQDTTNTRGWSIAHWLVANAGRFHVAEVTFEDKVWSAAKAARGWRPVGTGQRLDDTRIAVTFSVPSTR